MHCCILSPTTNTSTSMIWVTLKTWSAAEECRKPSANFILSGEWVTLYLELAQLEGQFYQLNMFFLCDVMDYNLGMEGQGHWLFKFGMQVLRFPIAGHT